ncbi:MAG: hypothetical protein JWM65_1973 [Sphingomonas bacterium]|nr:hypothetical protein [Sphingomonas bacterium]
MSLNDVAAIVNIVGVILVLIFTVRWGGRPPRNIVVGNIGLAMIFVAAVTHLTLRFSGRL